MIVISLILFLFPPDSFLWSPANGIQQIFPHSGKSAIQPECPGSSQTTIQHRESIGQYKAGRPQSESTNRHGNSTNTVRENLRDNDPHHCSQSHSITGNSHHNNNQQHNSCDMKIISGSIKA